MTTLRILLCLLVIPVFEAAPAQAHVFYVSITRVKWNADEARLDLTVRIFTGRPGGGHRAGGRPPPAALDRRRPGRP